MQEIFLSWVSEYNDIMAASQALPDWVHQLVTLKHWAPIKGVAGSIFMTCIVWCNSAKSQSYELQVAKQASLNA